MLPPRNRAGGKPSCSSSPCSCCGEGPAVYCVVGGACGCSPWCCDVDWARNQGSCSRFVKEHRAHTAATTELRWTRQHVPHRAQSSRHHSHARKLFCCNCFASSVTTALRAVAFCDLVFWYCCTAVPDCTRYRRGLVRVSNRGASTRSTVPVTAVQQYCEKTIMKVRRRYGSGARDKTRRDLCCGDRCALARLRPQRLHTYLPDRPLTADRTAMSSSIGVKRKLPPPPGSPGYLAAARGRGQGAGGRNDSSRTTGQEGRGRGRDGGRGGARRGRGRGRGRGGGRGGEHGRGGGHGGAGGGAGAARVRGEKAMDRQLGMGQEMSAPESLHKYVRGPGNATEVRRGGYRPICDLLDATLLLVEVGGHSSRGQTGGSQHSSFLQYIPSIPGIQYVTKLYTDEVLLSCCQCAPCVCRKGALHQKRLVRVTCIIIVQQQCKFRGRDTADTSVRALQRRVYDTECCPLDSKLQL